MLFGGLWTHQMMAGAITLATAIVGHKRANEIQQALIARVTARRDEEAAKHQRTVVSVGPAISDRHLVTLSNGKTYNVRSHTADQARAILELGHRVRTLSGKGGIHGFADVDVEAARPVFRYASVGAADTALFKPDHTCEYCEPNRPAEKPPALAVLQTVKSSNVAALGAAGEDAIVLFKSGGAYRYVGAGSRVPESHYAQSVGQWVNGELVNRGLYRCVKLTDAEVEALVIYAPGQEPAPQ